MTNDNGLWPTQTFTYGPVTATVERQTVAHSITMSRVINALPTVESTEESVHRDLFARIVTQTTQVEGLDLKWPELGANREEWTQAYQDFLRMDAGLMNRWYEALEEVDKPYNDREMWPPYRLTDEERKNRRQAGSKDKAASGKGSPTSKASTPAR
jgi:hypothetical protein